jgi:hypothetical protein
MTQDEIINMARDSGMDLYGLGKDRYRFVHHLEAFAKLVAAKEREEIEKLHQHEDVLAPVGNSAWGEAYQEGWASGTRAYLEAIRARSGGE